VPPDEVLKLLKEMWRTKTRAMSENTRILAADVGSLPSRGGSSTSHG
jgi:hypothetical protein